MTNNVSTPVAGADSLWRLVWGRPSIDPADLATALDQAAGEPDLDFRTRLLIRDSLVALAQHWGTSRLQAWLARAAHRARLERIQREDLGEPGFPFIREALMDRTRPDTVEQLFRDLGTHLDRPLTLTVGGSIALILPGLLSRATQDIDVVDEIPAAIREDHQHLDKLRQLYQLQLTHFQSHFLPAGWQNRVHPLAPFGQLQVSLVDPVDVFLSKLFSGRTKDQGDLRMLLPQLDRDAIIRRLNDTCVSFLKDDTLKAHAERNWYILTGEPLPIIPPAPTA